MQKRLFLLDGMALVYRSFYALNKNPRINSKGLNTSAILGFSNTVCDLIKNQKPTHIACAFDTQKPTFRHEKFEAYKAHRDAMPEEICHSLPYIFRFLDAMRIPILRQEGFEADDIIGTLSKEAEKSGFTVFMVTPDKDFGQLVSENIFMYRPGRMGNGDEIWGTKEVLERFSIKRPDQVRDILGLWGDASDNIPGIPGIGEKKAKQLVEEYDSIENLIANADSIGNERMRNQVKDNAELAVISKELATIELNVPIEIKEDFLVLETPDFKEIKQLFEELEFRNFAKRFFLDFAPQQAPVKENTVQNSQFSLFQDENSPTLFDSSFNSITTSNVDYKPIETEEDIDSLIKNIEKNRFFSFFITTNGVAFSHTLNKAYFVDFKKEDYISKLASIFDNKALSKITYDLKKAKFILHKYKIAIQGQCFDSLIAHYLLESEMRHALDLLCENYLSYKLIHESDVFSKDGKPLDNAEIFLKFVCERADLCLQLFDKFEPLLRKTNMLDLFYNVEMPLVDVLFKMELEGVNIDKDYLQQYSLQLQKEKKSLEEEIYKEAGEVFNIASPKQLGEILFNKLKIVEKPKQTATKQFSTGEEILAKLVNKHPIVSLILSYRGLSKLINTYAEALPQLISPETGRIHTSFNQTVTATGRLSSTNPNLQNIPIRTEQGKQIRKAFIPRNKDYALVSADYSQIELRIIASLSNDKNMLEAFSNNVDIHTSTASKIYKVPLDEVTKVMRRNAKSVNFGIIYGISAFGLSEQLNIPRKEASDLIEEYFLQYPDIKAYIDKSIEEAQSQGYAKTILGRRRKLPDINSGNRNLKGFAERNAVNMPIQGTAADMIKLAMIHVSKELENRKLQSKIILQVHDELVLDVPKSELNEAMDIVKTKMQMALPLNVPIDVDISSGKDWLEAH